MSTMGQAVACLLSCVLISSMTVAKSKHLPGSLNQMQGKSKAPESGQSAHQMDRRSVPDNRIASIPSDLYDRRLNELPFAHTYHQARPVFAPSKPHRRPEVDPERRPDFGLDLRNDMFMALQPPEVPSFRSQNGRPKVPVTFGRQGPVQQHHRQQQQQEQGLPVFPLMSEGPGDRLVDSSRHRMAGSPLPLLSTRPLEALAPLSQHNPEADFWSEVEEEEVGQRNHEKGSSSSEKYPALDPFFLSGIDLENLPEEDASLGDAVLAEMLGSALPPTPAPVQSKVDEETEDIMADFLTFLDLRASGALDSCLNKSPGQK